MGRKPITKDHISSSRKTNQDNTNGLYQKRLRSWKQRPTQLKSNNTAVSPSIIHDEVIPLHRSTLYTYPINLSNDRQSILTNTIFPESVTTESAFYCPSISYTSIQTTGDLNNNHVTTLNIEKKKRKHNTSSCESLSSGLSQLKTSEILFNPNDVKNISTKRSSTNNLQLTYHRSPIKRSRFSTEDSIITNHRFLNSTLLADDNTIDINQSDQQEPLLSSMNNESLINNSNSMETAVKMVQPIVDIIFNAFEDQFKNVQTKTIQPSLPSCPSISSQFYSPMMIPYVPLTSPTRPIVLHAVNFNIQLTTKQPAIHLMEKHLTDANLNENNNLQSLPLIELKQKVLSYILSNSLINNHGKRRKLKRIVQLAVIGVSVLCGYLLL